MSSHRKGLLICFTGIDGTGKTTNASNLFKFLKTEGYDAKLIYGRLDPIILRPFIYIGRKTVLKNTQPSQYTAYSQNRQEKIIKHPFLTKIYVYLLLFDTFIQLYINVIIPKRKGSIIISDRYVIDTVITDLSRFIGDEPDEIKNIIKKMFQLTANPDLLFFLSVPPGICFERKNDVPNIQYLELLDRLYSETLSGYKNVIRIDGTTSLENILDITSEKSLTLLNKLGENYE